MTRKLKRLNHILRQKKQKEPEKLATYKETLELCKLHLEEVEALEKKRVLDGHNANRGELMHGANNNHLFVNFSKGLMDIN